MAFAICECSIQYYTANNIIIILSRNKNIRLEKQLGLRQKN